jgi:23S rRNA pseudouridine1911/1915/1917 synthase
MKKKFKVTAKDAGQRLDTYLTAKLPEASRSRIQKWIKSDMVTVNERTVTPHLALQEKDVVEITDDAKVTAVKGLALIPRPDIGVDVVYEDDDIVVVNKPSGLIVHPAVPGETDTLANALLAQYPEIATVGDDPERPGIVHRLDREASGLLVVARTKAAFDNLKAQFQAHVVKKEYAVLIDGYPPEDAGTIKMPIGRSASGGKMAARPIKFNKRTGEMEITPGDRTAITHYRIEEKLPKVTFLTVKTETGRTHQIRAHFHALGVPVVGDPLYGTNKIGRFNSSRLFLHAKSLAFLHPVTDKELSFAAPLPKELEEILKRARK